MRSYCSSTSPLAKLNLKFQLFTSNVYYRQLYGISYIERNYSIIMFALHIQYTACSLYRQYCYEKLTYMIYCWAFFILQGDLHISYILLQCNYFVLIGPSTRMLTAFPICFQYANEALPSCYFLTINWYNIARALLPVHSFPRPCVTGEQEMMLLTLTQF